jgi:hypothetical protein
MLTGIIALLFYRVLVVRGGNTAVYRLFALFYLATWSAILWLQSYRPTPALFLGSACLLGLLFSLVFLPRRPPASRRETKDLLDQLQTEKRLAGYLGSAAGRWYWPFLVITLWSIFYRLALLFSQWTWHGK